MRRRLLQRLQQSVERVAREHVDFVDDEDLGARLKRAEARLLDDFAHIVHAGARGGVHLHHIRVAVGEDRRAIRADAAGIGGRPAGPVRPHAVQRAGDDPRRRGLADPAHAGEHEGMGDAPCGEGVAQGAHHRFLSDQVVEGGRPVFAGEDAVGLGLRRPVAWHRRGAARRTDRGRGAVCPAVDRPGAGRAYGAEFSRRGGPCLLRLRSCGSGWEAGQRPGRNSLRLLPSGPDRVGEALVRRRLPEAQYDYSAVRGKRSASGGCCDGGGHCGGRPDRPCSPGRAILERMSGAYLIGSGGATIQVPRPPFAIYRPFRQKPVRCVDQLRPMRLLHEKSTSNERAQSHCADEGQLAREANRKVVVYRRRMARSPPRNAGTRRS